MFPSLQRPAPPPRPVPPVPPLPKIQAPTAADLATKFKPSAGGQALLKPGQTPREYLQSLQEHRQSMDAVNVLAHGMPERDSVSWACQSSQKVSGKLNPADHSALSAAQEWVKNPSPQTQAAAAAAAKKTDYTGPGAWAAQAAAWSKAPAPAGPGIPKAPAAPGAPSLPGAAVAGSVLLAAGLVQRPPMPTAPQAPAAPTIPTAPALPAIPSVPQVAAPAAPAAPTPPPPPELTPLLDPFIALGITIAAG